jgi:small-conductance mechanosensitive channel
MTETRDMNSQIQEFIVNTIKIKKPKTTKVLVGIVQEKYSFSEKEITAILLNLEAEHTISIANKESNTNPQLCNQYIFSSKTVWYWLTLLVATVTTIAVFTIPYGSYPLVLVRQVTGALFVLFLPGFVFVRALFPFKVSKENSSDNMTAVERISLSFGLSLVLTAIVGLILNFTGWGIRLTPLIFSLLAFTVFFATTAVLREYQAKGQALKSSA